MKLDRLTEIRTEQGITQELLAEMSGVSVRTIQRIEAGYDTSSETAKSLSSALELENYHKLITAKNSVKDHPEYGIIKTYTYDFIDSSDYKQAYSQCRNFWVVQRFGPRAFLVIPFIYLIVHSILGESRLVSEMSPQEMNSTLLVFFGPVVLWIVSYLYIYRNYIFSNSKELEAKGANISKHEFSDRMLEQDRLSIAEGISVYSNCKVDQLPKFALDGDTNARAILGYKFWNGGIVSKDINKGVRHLE